MASPQTPGNAQTVARNSFWFSLELLFGLLASFATSVLVARTIGPVRLSYFNYMVWLTNITAAVGAFGLPVTTRKYMAEYLNKGERGVARSVYLATLRIQGWIAAGVTLLALGLVFTIGDPHYRTLSILLVLNMPPRMLGFIPSQANNADEVMRRNTGPSLVGAAVTVTVTLFSLWMGWGLIGVSAAVPAGALLETGLKLRTVESWLGGEVSKALSPELKRRMLTYSSQGLGLMLLNVVVWDRSDMFFLKLLNSDVRQITFFALAFNVTERILMLPTAFGASLSVTIMAQYGRGQSRLEELTVNGARYAALLAVPLLAGVAAISNPLVPLLYGKAYEPMTAVLAVSATLAISKALITAPTQLLQATENQGFLLLWGCICGAVDVLLDFLLVPSRGATGAAWANGLAQTLACVGVWTYAWRRFRLDLRLNEFARLAAAGILMVAGVLACRRWLHGTPGLAAAVLLGAAIWLGALRLLRVLTAADGERLTGAGRVLPAPVRPYWMRLIGLLAPA